MAVSVRYYYREAQLCTAQFYNDMKLTLMQKIFAHDWPMKIWFTVVPLFFTVGIVSMCEPSWALMTNWKSLLGLTAVIVLSLILGFFASLLVGWPILGSLYYDRELKNGGPFQLLVS